MQASTSNRLYFRVIWLAVITLPSTVCPLNRRRFWNVLAIPAFARPAASVLPISIPLKRISPSVGGILPEIILITVLFPAPFVPMSP